MLDGAFTSPKIRRLAVILDLPWPHALGIAGLLWRFTAKHAPTGEIGRHDDEEIAAALEWAGPAEDLVSALVRCRLLDLAPGSARLIVHDWPDHAPRYVSATLKRRRARFSPHYNQDDDADATADPSTDKTGDIPTTESTETTTSSSSSSSTKASTKAITKPKPQAIPDKVIEAIWSLWVPGRKTGKTVGLRKIRESIDRLSRSEQMTIEDASRWIADRTRADADRYKQDIEKGQTELKFVPLASTYFSQERWNDNDPRPDIGEIRRTSIADEIRRTREKLGSQLDTSA